ncbi:TlpA disulfide reductase family protein [Dyadobacter sp. CY312]|uniref:TlpA family protein disulfide reductase n=1 Tax=Dyadobacter sp. CY312 TaxID=2907303 RepID=UPI001F490A47|nr:TlpA disulfide reductase family protein [Dyadobacter sp. CY312]MCE7041389.1 TlpA family protein disulfide reductase [Dyadobacter sp. CY312]
MHLDVLISVLLVVIINVSVSAQPEKPKVYIDPGGHRYTKSQFDSISVANRGKPIAIIDKMEKDSEVQFTFEVLTIDPFEEFASKWIGKSFPAFNLKDLSGKLHDNSSFSGKLVVINLWSTTCAPCIEEMPRLNELVGRYYGKPVVFIAPAPEQSEKIKIRLAKHPFNYLILPGASQIFAALEVDSYPYHIIVDQSGIIKAIYHGSRTDLRTNSPILNEKIVSSIEENIIR